MKRVRLTMSQALVQFLDNQYIECDGVESKFVSGIFGIFGHGCVVGVGQALEQGGHNLKFYQGKNEQNMALAAVAYAKQMDRKAIIPCVSSIGPGATNMVTACGCATANRIPLLVLPGDTFACRQPDPVLQQAEFFDNYGRTVTDAFKGVYTGALCAFMHCGSQTFEECFVYRFSTLLRFYRHEDGRRGQCVIYGVDAVFRAVCISRLGLLFDEIIFINFICK